MMAGVLKSKRLGGAFAVVFVFVLWVPLVLFALGLRHDSGEAEKRELADWPALSLGDMDGFFTGGGDYFDDRFPFRARLIAGHSFLRHYVFGVASEQVMVGKDHWLFFRGNEVFEDYLGQKRMSEAELDAWFAYFEERQRSLEEKGIDYLLVIVPGKVEVESEKLPATIAAGRRETRLDQIIERIEGGSELNVLNLKPDLLEWKASDGEMFWPYDTHWNGTARLKATRVIADRVKEMLPEIDVDLITGSLETYSDERLCDLIDMLGLRGRWGDYQLNMMRWDVPESLVRSESVAEGMDVWTQVPAEMSPVVTENPEGAGRLLFVTDSFFRAGGVPLEKMDEMPMSFAWKRFVGLWMWISVGELDWIVEEEKPDLVIEQRVERYLHILPE